MNSNNKKEQKDPTKENIKFILELFNSSKLTEVKKEIDKQIIKYPNSFILFNILGWCCIVPFCEVTASIVIFYDQEIFSQARFINL